MKLRTHGMTAGLLAELTTADAMVDTLRALRERGYTMLDAWSPYPVREAEDAIALPRSPVPLIVFCAALTGAVLGYLIQWWTAAVSYPLDVGGRPAHAAPAFVPITFETTILFGGLAAFLSALALARLPRLHHPLDEVPGFERASIDRFFVGVDARDPHFSTDLTREHLAALAPLRVVAVGT
jgi:hypothetical protein